MNADGKVDIVLDTSFYEQTDISTVGDIYTISYIPHYSTAKEYKYGLYETIQYSQSLGNNYYYMATDRNTAKIFCMKNNWEELVLHVHYDFVDAKGRNSNHYYLHTYAYNKPALTLSLKAHKKEGRALWISFSNLIQYYLEHPEKLPIDFPMN